MMLNSDEATIRDTILHEIAHALTPGQHHNDVWRRKATAIGCTGQRCAKIAICKPRYQYTSVLVENATLKDIVG